MTSVVIDCGGSSVRIAAVREGEVGRVQRVEVSSYSELVSRIRAVCDRPRSIAVSIAGFVDSAKGHVRLSRNAGWAEGDLARRLRDEFGCPAVVMNDGEAHALAMLRTAEVRLGAVSVSLGTAVGIGVLSADGELVRPCSGENWDLGDWQLTTRASDKSLWWALGSHGLQELEHGMGANAGANHFGYRLGAFFVELTVVFQPRTIVVSGGIASRYWRLMESSVMSELARVPAHFERPRIRQSPFGEAALVGATQALTQLS